MLPRELLALLLALTQCAVRAAPLSDTDIIDPLQPLESAASKLLSFTTIFDSPDGPGTQATATAVTSNANTRLSSQSAAQSSDSQNGVVSSSTPETTESSGSGSLTVSGTVTQVSSGGVSPTATSDLDPTNTATTASAGAINTAPGSSGSSAGVVPTTTGSNGASQTSTSLGSGSDPSSSPSSGSGSGSGDGSGGSSGTGSGSGSSAADSASSNGLSPGEIAAAVILPVLALLALLFLLVRYQKPLREKYSAWRQQSAEQSAYRRALNDPVLSFGMRQSNAKGLGIGDVEALIQPKRPRPLSFGFSNKRPFPKQQRKPVNWDAGRIGRNSAAAIGMAVPMPVSQHSRSASESSEDSDIYGGDDRPGSGYQDARSTQVSPENVVP